MIEFRQSKLLFDEYISKFDKNNDKVLLKIIHINAVVEASEYLGEKLKLDEENFQLARVIALLHDIGRFSHIELFGTFDDGVMDHATLGIKILRKNNFIRNFLNDQKYDEIIYASIGNHNKYTIEPGLTGSALFHSQLIRDADKMDNFRVSMTEDFETLYDVSIEEINSENISPKVFEEFIAYHLIRREDIKTHIDMWLSEIAFMFDFNFKESLKYIRKKNYIDIMFSRINPKNFTTLSQYHELYIVAKDYLKRNI